MSGMLHRFEDALGRQPLAVRDPSACEACGREGCEGCETPRLQLRTVDEVIALPRAEAVVEGFVYAGRLTILASEPASGKTFLVLDVAACISSGCTWHGRRTQLGSVAYLGYEGDSLSLRLRAIRDCLGLDLDNVYLAQASDTLTPAVARDGAETKSIGELASVEAITTLTSTLARSGRPPIRMIVVDTIRQSHAGSEDSSDAVSSYLRAVRRIVAAAPHAGIVLVHHLGWQDQPDTRRKRERGSSAWRGAADCSLLLEAGEYDPHTGEAALTVSVAKLRDEERAAPLNLVRRRVELTPRPTDDPRHGIPTSCIIVTDTRDRGALAANAAVASAFALDLRVLRVVRDHDITSVAALRLHVPGRNADLGQALARLQQRGWIARSAQRAPFTVTVEGDTALEGATR